MTTRVVSVKVAYIRPKYHDLQEWVADPENVYIGRRGIVFVKNPETGSNERFPKQDSVWANPFKIGRDGDREEVLAKYRVYITEKLKNGDLDIEELRGKTIGCWCVDSQGNKLLCHGDILIELLSEK